MSLDVRQRDLYISQLAGEVDQAAAECRRLAIALRACEDEVVRWRLKYDDDMRESNGVIKRLRKMVEERDDEIRLLRMQREESLAGSGGFPGASRVGHMADKLRELAARNRDLEEMLEKMSKELADGAIASTKRPETTQRTTAGDNRGITARLTIGLPDQTTEINSLRVEKV